MTTETAKQFFERIRTNWMRHRLPSEADMPGLLSLALRGAAEEMAADDQALRIKRLEAEVERKDAALRLADALLYLTSPKSNEAEIVRAALTQENSNAHQE